MDRKAYESLSTDREGGGEAIGCTQRPWEQTELVPARQTSPSYEGFTVFLQGVQILR